MLPPAAGTGREDDSTEPGVDARVARTEREDNVIEVS